MKPIGGIFYNVPQTFHNASDLCRIPAGKNAYFSWHPIMLQVIDASRNANITGHPIRR